MLREYISPVDHAVLRALSAILRQLDRLEAQGGRIMATAAQMKADLEEANLATNEIADDMNDLITRLAGQGPAGPLTEAESEDVKAQLDTLMTKLKGVAAVYTPTPAQPAQPAEPVVQEGGPANKG